jgi:TonB-dependent SusC/RagA subfamily outer membrane receptor
MKKTYIKQRAYYLILLLFCFKIGVLSAADIADIRAKTFAKKGQQTQNILPLKVALQDLAARHKVVFHYNSPIVKDKTVRDLAVDDLVKSLQLIENQTNLSFEKIKDNHYMLLDAPKKQTPALPNTSGSAVSISPKNALLEQAQKPVLKLTGVVNDAEKNEPLVGVSVVMKGTTVGTVTDENGNFSLDIPTEKGVLLFSFIGYQAQEVNIGKQTKLNIQLLPNVQALNEVVVVGYGTRKRDELSGAVTSINSEMISLQPVVSIDQALQGMSPGVSLREGSGAPGAGPEILVRGINTFGNNKPLFVIDDVIFENGNDQNNNPLALINPEDIENVVILKDAATKAIYGSRATGGVILVTTKRGKLGKPKITFNSNIGLWALKILMF